MRSVLVSFLVFSVAINIWAMEKTFIYCSEGSPSSFNPQLATDGASFNASSRTIYDRLVDFSPGSTSIISGLAKSWTVSKSSLVYTFKLHKGVKFHSTKNFKPTRNFNADDVVFSFRRMMDKKNPYHLVSGGTYEYFQNMEMGKIIKRVKKVDNYTVQFILSRPEAPFLANLAMDFASILSKEYADKMLIAKTPEKTDRFPVGTGPFKFKKYIKDTLIRYTAHKDYFKGKAFIDRLVFSITPDASVRFQKLKAGECHLVGEPSPTDLKSMRVRSDIHVMEQEGLNVGYVAMNVEKKPLNSLLVRKAINYALNRRAYIKAIYLGNAMVAKNPIPPTIWGYNNKIKDYEYDIKKAKSLLKKAGYSNGFEIELWTLPISRPYNPNGKKMGELIQADLAKIGIKVKLITYDWPTYLSKARKGEHQMIQLGWTGDNGDPDNFMNVLLGCAAVEGGGNLARWKNKNFCKLMVQAKSISNVKARTKFYLKAQEIFKKEAPWVPIAHSKVFRAMSKRVKGYQIHPFGVEMFHKVDLK